MTTLEIKKREFLKAIDSEETLDKLQKYLIRIKKRSVPPCQYTLEELNKHLDEGEKEVAKGGGIEHDKFFDEVVSAWL